MNILVTGGAGFIGSHFVHYMLETYPDIRLYCIDKLTYAGNISSLEDVLCDPRFNFVRGDICNRRLVAEVMQRGGFDAVINFAAESHVDRSIKSPRVFTRTNLIGTQVLLDECLRRGVRFHQISTDEVYGDMPAGSKDKFTESSPLRPSSPYSASKAAADLMVLAYCRTYGLNATISRCSNNYGIRQFPEKLIPVTIVRALKGGRVPVFGDGLNERDWIATEDHCRAVDFILKNGEAGQVYNVGADCAISNLRLVERILSLLGKDENAVEFVADRLGHDRRYALDCTKLRAMGWRPICDFDAGIERIVRWYAEGNTWLNEVLSGAYKIKNNRFGR